LAPLNLGFHALSDIFTLLSEQHNFVQFVEANYREATTPLSEFMACEMDIDKERLVYAHQEYVQNIQRYSLLLESSNPDHYKRSGALLHALYGSNVITEVRPTYDNGEISNGVALIHPHDEGRAFAALEFYKEYHNQIHAFDLAYRVCASYEDLPVRYDFDYLHNTCVYMIKNSAISVDTFFMMFKSLMAKTPGE
jgi:hypothetical protein